MFAPTDEAFAKVDPATIDKLKTDSELLTSILTYHVVAGPGADPTAVVGDHKTVQGESVKVTGSGQDLKVNDAGVVCGGDVEPGTLVSEEYLMALERQAFCSLIVHPKTQERIMGMLSTGKPLRN